MEQSLRSDWKADSVTDILDDVPILLACPANGCPGEIASTFGRLRAKREVSCPLCNVKTWVDLDEETLEAARAALAGLGKAGADGGT
jgi:hypothetical protein